MKFRSTPFFSALFLAGIFFSCHQNLERTHSLSATDSILIGQLKSKSVAMYDSNQDSFAALQLQIAAKYKHADQLGNWLNCYDTTIRAYRKHDSLQKALDYLVDLNTNMWREPTDSFSLITLAESNRQIAFIYYIKRSNYAKALNFYDQGIGLITTANAWTPDRARLFYKAAGNCASRMDDYQKSINYHERNVQICRSFKDTVNLFQALNDLSIPYDNIGQFDKEEQALRESWALVNNSDSVEQKSDVCNSFTELFIQTDKLDSAQKYIQLCFTYLAQWKNREADSEGDAYRLQAEIFSLQKNYASAEKSYSKSVELMKSEEDRKRECGKILGEFGNMYVDAGKEKLAMEKFHESLQCLIPDFKSDDVIAAPDTSLLYDENGIFITCDGMGDACMQLYYETHDLKYLKYAAQHYHAAKIVLDKRDKGMQNEASRIQFGESVKTILAKSNKSDSLLRLQNSN